MLAAGASNRSRRDRPRGINDAPGVAAGDDGAGCAGSPTTRSVGSTNPPRLASAELLPGSNCLSQTNRVTPASKTDGSQSLDLQRDALRAAGVDAVNLYHDFASGLRDDRPGLDSCLRALREGDVLVVWKLDRLGRNLAHLVNTVQGLSARGVGLRVLVGDGAQIDTTTAAGRLVFGIFAALAEFERELIRERTVAGLKAARARGRKGGRKFALTKAQVRLAQAAMAHRDTSVSALCRELGIRPVTLYRYVGPQGELREQGQKVLAS